MPSSSAYWGQVTRDAELACSQVASACRSLLETLVAVGQDVLQSARVSVKARKKKKLPFLTPSGSLLLGLNTASLLFLSFFWCSTWLGMWLRWQNSKRR
jgi:hypothetical protein